MTINESLQESIKTSDSEALAAQVVIYRVLNLRKEIATLCMEELVLRRKNGEEFDYEDWIDKKVAEMPKPQGLDLVNTSQQLVSAKKSILGFKK